MILDTVIGEEWTNIDETNPTSSTIKFNTYNSPSPDLKNTVSHLRNLNSLKEKGNVLTFIQHK